MRERDLQHRQALESALRRICKKIDEAKLKYEKITEEFKRTLAKLKAKLNDESILENLKPEMEKTIGTIIENFNNSSAQVEDGDREDKGEGRGARNQDEKRIEGLIGKLQEMSEDLDRRNKVIRSPEERERKMIWKDEIKHLSEFCKVMICDDKMQQNYCEISENIKIKYGIKALNLEDETNPSPVAIVAIKEINEELGKIVTHESNSFNVFDQETQQELEQKANEIEPSGHSYDKFENTKLSVKWEKFKENIELYKLHSYAMIDENLVDYMVKEVEEDYEKMLNGYKRLNGGQEQLWSIHEDFQEACRQVDALWWSIEPKKVGPSDRVERVNKAIDMFNKTVQEIKGELDAGYFTEKSKEETLKLIFALIRCFDVCANKALTDHGISRSKCEKGIEYINEGIEGIKGCLQTWKCISAFQARMKNTSASSNDSGSLEGSTSEVIKKLKREVELVYMDALRSYSHFADNYHLKHNIRLKNDKGVIINEFVVKPSYLSSCDKSINTTINAWEAFEKASQKVQEIQRDGMEVYSEKDMEKVKELTRLAKEGYNEILAPNSCRDAWELLRRAH